MTTKTQHTQVPIDADALMGRLLGCGYLPAHAGYIARAASAHEELLTICKAYLMQIESVELTADIQIDLWKRVVIAIAKAESRA